MNEEQFNALVDDIMALGYDEETAANYAALIGDTPIIEDGLVVVMENGQVLDRLALPQFAE